MVDLSILTDDQLVELARLVIDEALSRSAATAAHTEHLMLAARERAATLRAGSELQARAARAAERARAAAEGAAVLAEQRRVAEAAAAQAAAAQAREAEARRVAENRRILEEAAALLNKRPEEISVWAISGGRRLLINKGYDRFQREHLADYDGGKLRTIRGVDRTAVAAFAAATLAQHPTLGLRGDSLL